MEKDGQNYYKDGNFVIASKEAVKYMLDPRGHLNEKEVFQFQTLSYSSSMDSINSIEKFYMEHQCTIDQNIKD